MAAVTASPFQAERLGILMRADQGDPCEAWGVLNPGGTRGPDGSYYLFSRLVAQGNYSRIGRARVHFDAHGDPTRVERLGYALEPQEPYEVARLGGGVEDPRVTFVEPLHCYVMTYTAFVPHHPRVALAVSEDLVQWRRLGPLHYTRDPEGLDLSHAGNKDGVIFPDVVEDPRGQPALAILHRPTYAIQHQLHQPVTIFPPEALAHPENIWISFVPLDEVRKDITRLTHVREHRVLLAPHAAWEQLKVGAGAPPVRLPYGWLLFYHGVAPHSSDGSHRVRYAAGVAVLDLRVPTNVLYRAPEPLLEPTIPEEREGLVQDVVFPTATDLRSADRIDLYYGAADCCIGVARVSIPAQLPAPQGD